MNKVKQISLVIVGITLFLLSISSRTFSFKILAVAQDFESTDINIQDSQNSQEKEYVVQKERLAEEIEDLKLQLLSRLNQYERDEKQYRIAIDQYHNLQTLSSIEEAIEATKQTMLSRNEVLAVYQNLLRLQLIDSEGIELVHKREALSRVEENIKSLEEFKNQINQASDRSDINNLSVEFASLGKSIYETSYYALSILTIGKLQSTYDNALAIYQRVANSQEEKTDLANKAKIERSLSETNKLFLQIPPEFEMMWARVDASVERAGNSSYDDLYKNLAKDLMPLYYDLSKIVSYLKEIEDVE